MHGSVNQPWTGASRVVSFLRPVLFAPQLREANSRRAAHQECVS
jgi:hypothetical protein